MLKAIGIRMTARFVLLAILTREKQALAFADIVMDKSKN
jgi:hypothetical protein